MECDRVIVTLPSPSVISHLKYTLVHPAQISPPFRLGFRAQMPDVGKVEDIIKQAGIKQSSIRKVWGTWGIAESAGQIVCFPL